MPRFVIAYHGAPKFETKAEGQAHMTAWRAWSAGLGDALVYPGMPVGASTTLMQDGTAVEGGGANPLVGISVIEAADMDAAIALVRPCPHLSAGGTIELAQGMDMEM